LLRQQGWGFLALANGRLDNEILKAQKSGTSPAALARKDAAVAIAAARSEGFPAHTILFLDQEEGGILLPEQAAYLLFWTETVASSDFHDHRRHPRARRENAPPPHRHVRRTGCLPSSARLHRECETALERWPEFTESRRRPHRVAVLSIAAPTRVDPRLRDHLRGRRQLLCPRRSHRLARHGPRQQRRSLARPLEHSCSARAPVRHALPRPDLKRADPPADRAAQGTAARS